MRIRLERILPLGPILRVRPLRARTDRMLAKLGDDINRDLLRPTRTWSKAPIFVTRRGSNFVEVGTADDRYIYLNNGTNIRYAAMTRNFRPKTTPRSLSSRAGRGGAAIVGKRAFASRNKSAKPGIEAREWDILVREKYAPEISRRFNDILRSLIGF